MKQLIIPSRIWTLVHRVNPSTSSSYIGGIKNIVKTLPITHNLSAHTLHSRQYGCKILTSRILSHSVCMRVSAFKDTSSWQASPNCIRAWRVRGFFTSSTMHQSNDEKSKDKSNDADDDKPDDRLTTAAKTTFTTVSIFVFLYLGFNSLVRAKMGIQGNLVFWNEFVTELLAKGEVENVQVIMDGDRVLNVSVTLHPGSVFRGQILGSDLASRTFRLSVLSINELEVRLREAEAELGIPLSDAVPVKITRVSPLVKLAAAASFALALVVSYRLARRFTNKGFFMRGSKSKPEAGEPEKKKDMPDLSKMMGDMMGGLTRAKFIRADLKRGDGKGVSFADVAGLHEAKVEVMEFVDFLKKPEKFKEMGARLPHGALLLGPPGCGKTLLARAVATEAQVPFLAMGGSDFVEMIGGLGASRVRDLFKEAKKIAPCIIYIDEIDALGRNRDGGQGGGGNSEGEQTLNQLLVEMDGMETVEGVIIMASTNRPDVLDKALLRPGRFDRHITIEYPTLAERKDTFEMYLKRLKTVEPPSSYSQRLAQLSPGMTGADIANICNEAALHAARHQHKSIDHADFEYAIERTVAGVAKKSRVLSEQEKRIVAYHEAGHALTTWLLEHTPPLLKVTIVPRTKGALGFSQYMPQDTFLVSEQQMEENMCVALGGRVAESLVFNQVTSGAQDDLRRVTDIATKQVREFGMSAFIGHIAFPRRDDEFGQKPYSRKLAADMDRETSRIVAATFQKTENLLKNNTDKLKAIAEALLEQETLSFSDIEELIGPPPFPPNPLMIPEAVASVAPTVLKIV